MEIDVGTYVSDLLYKNEKVNIPGLGAFSADYKSAVIDHVQGKITPPSKDLNFNSNLVVNDGLLINYVKEKHDLSYAEAQKAVEDYVGRVKEAIARREIVVFPSVGRLYKDYEQKLQFLPDNTNFETNSFGLPTVQFYPIVKAEKKAPISELKSKKKGLNALSNPLSSHKISSWFQRGLPLIIVLSVIVVGTGLYFLLTANQSKKENIEISRVPESRVNISPTQEDPQEEGTTSATPDELAEDLPEDQNSDLIEVTADEDLDTEAPTPAPNQKYCVIAIGVFGSKKNIEKLVQKIYEEGFEPYTEQKGNLTKVGVQMAYDDDAELKAALNTVRRKFGQDAKIIKK